MAPEQFAVRGRYDSLDHAVGFSHGAGFAIGLECSLAYLHVKALRGTLCLGQSDHGALGMREDSRRYRPESVTKAKRNLALRGGGVRQHATAVDVTYGID